VADIARSNCASLDLVPTGEKPNSAQRYSALPAVTAMGVGKLNWPRREFWKAVVQMQPVLPFLPHGVVADLADAGSASNGDCLVYSRSCTGRDGRRRRMVALAASAAPSLDPFARVAMRRQDRAVLPAPASAYPARVAAWSHLASQGLALPGSHANGAQKCRPLQRSQSQWSVCATMRYCRLRRAPPVAAAPA